MPTTAARLFKVTQEAVRLWCHDGLFPNAYRIEMPHGNSAELQAKNAAIQAQQLTIDIQKGLLSGEIIIDSLKDVTPKPEDKENLPGGVFALATYKDKGIEVNLAELYRKLRRLFKDKE